MITPDDVFDILKLCAAFDQRTVGEADVTAWSLVATQHSWNPAAAKRVIVDHYGSGADKRRLTPAVITDRLKALRNAAAETFEAPRIPDDLPAGTDMADWFRRRKDAHVLRALDHWARTGVEPARAVQGGQGLAALYQDAPPEIAAGIAKMMGRQLPEGDR